MKSAFWEKRRIIRESDLSMQFKWLLTVLADYAGESEWSHPSQTTLARDLSTSKRHVIRLLKQATDQNHIESRRRRRQTNQYRICWEKIGDLSVTIKPVLEVTPESPIGDTQVTGGGDTSVTQGVTPVSHRTTKEHPEGTSKEHTISKTGKQAEEIYQAYPRKIAKPAALKAIEKALKKTSFEDLMAAVCEYVKSRDGEDPNFTPHPATWFNQERWNDDRTEWKSSNGRAGKRRVGPGEQYDPNHKATF